MKLRRVIGAPKLVTSWGAWKSGDKMPKTAYPLTKNTTFKVSAPYSWRLVTFECLGAKFRLLIAYRLDISRAFCYLGKEVGTDTLTMARYEYHATEPGWHLHCFCDDDGKVAGSTKCDDKRIPQWDGFHKQFDLDISGEEAMMDRAVSFFKLRKHPPLELTG